MVEFYIKDKKESLSSISHKSTRGKSLVNPPKKPYLKFIRQEILDKTYNSQIFEKVLTNQDKIMSHYHEILERTLNSSIYPQKHPEDQFQKPNPIWFSKSKSGSQVSQKYESDLIKYLTPSKDISSKDSPFACGLSTFKLLKDLSQYHSLCISVPDTLIYGHGFEKATFIYNDSKGNLQFLQTLNLKAFDLITKILTKKRIANERIIAPIAIGRTSNSEGNKVFMRMSEIKIDLKNIHKNDLAIQHYVLPKGNMGAKFRLVFREECLKVFVVNGKKRFDRSVYMKKSEKLKQNEATSIKPGSHSSGLNAGSRSSGYFPNLKFELAKKLTERAKFFNRLSFSLPKETKYDTLNDFMSSVHTDTLLPELDSLFTDLLKACEKPTNEELEILHEDNISSKIINKLRRMFCTYSKSASSSSITELKSPKTCESLVTLFNSLKHLINSTILRPQNLKISELICDFFEDTSKKLFLSQVKSCRCTSKVYVPLRSIIRNQKEKHKFKCPGKYCDLNSSSIQVEVFTESILMQGKKVFPRKCTILRGTLLSDRFEATDNMQKLNPRLFESVQVCETCFLAYNEQSNKLTQHPTTKPEKKTDLDEEVTKKLYKQSLNKQHSHLLELDKKLNRCTKKIISQQETHSVVAKKPDTSTSFSFFKAKRNSISRALQLEEFVDNKT